MIPYTVLLLIFAVILYILAYLSSKDRHIKGLLERKSKSFLNLEINLNKQKFERSLYEVANDFNYRIEYVKNNQYILSENMSFFSYGFYYLLEFKDNKVDLYLKPRYFLEWNRFNYFKYKLEKLSALIELIKSDSKN